MYRTANPLALVACLLLTTGCVTDGGMKFANDTADTDPFPKTNETGDTDTDTDPHINPLQIRILTPLDFSEHTTSDTLQVSWEVTADPPCEIVQTAFMLDGDQIVDFGTATGMGGVSWGPLDLGWHFVAGVGLCDDGTNAFDIARVYIVEATE